MVLLFSSFSEVQISFAPSRGCKCYYEEAARVPSGGNKRLRRQGFDDGKIKTNGFILYFVHFSITSQLKIIGI